MLELYPQVLRPLLASASSLCNLKDNVPRLATDGANPVRGKHSQPHFLEVAFTGDAIVAVVGFRCGLSSELVYEG